MSPLMKTLVTTAALAAMTSTALAGEVSDNIRIDSDHLGYALQYRVYTPSGVVPGKRYPVLLVTDGQWYLEQGEMATVLDSMIGDGDIPPVYVVFVDSRDPDRLDDNRRYDEFMCKVDYANFYTAELLPALYTRYPISMSREGTSILGLSFGGLNSACFGALASPRFAGIGMHSPASDQHIEAVLPLYRDWDQEPLNVYVSAGTRRDNLGAARKLVAALEQDGHAVTFDINRGATHDWKNWREMLDDALIALLGPGAAPVP